MMGWLAWLVRSWRIRWYRIWGYRMAGQQRWWNVAIYPIVFAEACLPEIASKMCRVIFWNVNFLARHGILKFFEKLTLGSTGISAPVLVSYILITTALECRTVCATRYVFRVELTFLARFSLIWAWRKRCIVCTMEDTCQNNQGDE